MARLTLRETMDRLLLVIQSGYPVVYIVSHEEQRVLDYLAKLLRVIRRGNPLKHLLVWSDGDALRELALPDADGQPGREVDWLDQPGLDAQGSPLNYYPDKNTPGKALEEVRLATEDSFPEMSNSLSVFFDLHPDLQQGGALVRRLRNTAAALRSYYDQNRRPASEDFKYKTVVIVAPTAALDRELERDVFVIDFPLPERDELRREVERLEGRQVLRCADPERPGDPTRDQLPDLVAGAGRGLTLDAFRLALNGIAVRGGALSSERIEDILYQKAKAINNPALQYTPHVDIELGGLEAIKSWIRARRDPARIASVRERYHLPPLRGVMLCGVSGGGKSMLAQLMAREFNLALLRLDVGALFASYVGESEQRTRDALQLAEVLAPIVLWLDEVEKAFSGIQGGGDSGVSARVFGSFLTWLSEKQDSVFVVATANDFEVILNRFPEFGRKGRFDEIFWVDLPDKRARADIFRIKLKHLFDNGYITTTLDQIRQLAQQRRLPVPGDHELADMAEQVARSTVRAGGEAARPDPRLLALCVLLGGPTISGNMTGAEIEHAVKECLYGIYNLPEEKRTGEELGRLIVQTVEEAKKRAMYGPSSKDLERLEELRKKAKGNNWPMVGGEQ
jgi:hypothetical protein